MNEQEKEILELTSTVWNKSLELEGILSQDIEDLAFHIHAIQRIIMARAAYREDPFNIFHPKQNKEQP